MKSYEDSLAYVEQRVDGYLEAIKENFDSQMADSKLHGDSLNKEKRNSQNAWIPTNHWVGGFLWHYIQRANRENFLYDLRCIDGESMQYTRYTEGQFYGWHCDGQWGEYKLFDKDNQDHSSTALLRDDNGKLMPGLAGRPQFVDNTWTHNAEWDGKVRKLSMTVNLTDPGEYSGGEFQIAVSYTHLTLPTKRIV